VTKLELKIGLFNESKLSKVDFEVLATCMADRHIKIGFISEAAQPGTGVDSILDNRFGVISETDQKKGGAGFIVERGILRPGDNGTTWSNRTRTASTAHITIQQNLRLVSIYCNPDRTDADAALLDLLDRLSKITELTQSPRCIIGGDFNAATGTSRREDLDT